jgi:hypothetical protein
MMQNLNVQLPVAQVTIYKREEKKLLTYIWLNVDMGIA